MPLSKAHSTLLKSALEEHKPFYSEGIWPILADELQLFYAAEESVERLSFTDASTADLHNLANACQPATFGLNQEDILDESYRKAGKIDLINFAINLSVESSGLLQSARNSLLGWQEDQRPIKAKLYKLNVYGPGSFFKSHKDTPLATTMFGSLVVILPTNYLGGELKLRHGEKTFVHDCSNKFTPGSNSVAWIAFYSDVEHEVLSVTEGYRVTLTYNLFFTQKERLYQNPSIRTTPLFETFSKLLSDPEFLPNGGTLAFGLQHQYPTNEDSYSRLYDLYECLKGGDETLFSVASLLGLDPTLRLVYDDGAGGTYLANNTIGNVEDEEVQDVREHLRSVGAVLAVAGDKDEPGEVKLQVEWVTDTYVTISDYYVAYGNEMSLGHFYGEVHLYLTIGDKTSRDL